MKKKQPIPKCQTCGVQISWSANLCGPCWEVEHRLTDYLKRGGSRALLVFAKALSKASKAAGGK